MLSLQASRVSSVMMDSVLPRSLLLVMALGLSACVSERVVLLPSSDGRPSGVVVTTKGEALVLDEPYATAALKGEQPVRTSTSAEDVQEHFGAVLAQLPEPAESFVLYFLENSSELAPGSESQLDLLRQALARRTVGEILIIGHTDTTGPLQRNDELSLERAISVREMLHAEGIDVKMDVAGRGERELLVPTGDNVKEPRNRRVEIRVR